MSILAVILACLVSQATQPTNQANSTRPSDTRPASKTSPNILAGPSATEPAAAQPTLIKRAFDGTLEDVGPEPDVVAADMLSLTDDQRRQYDSILSERRVALDQTVRANYGLIVELASLQNEQDQEKRMELLNKARAAFAPYLKRGSFIDEMQEHLTMPQREQINKMLFEYAQARIDEAQRHFGLTHQQAAWRVRLESFGHLIRESIERQVSLERESFDELAKELDLTDDQKNKAQTVLGPLAIKRFQRLDNAAERAQAYAEFRRILTPAQRLQLLAMLVKQWRPPPAATQPQR